LPLDIDEILSVKDYEMTMAMEGFAKSGEEVQKLPFPIPDCLRTPEGKVRAEFVMTLVYDPPVNANKAFEYCQVNLGVGLGSIEVEENGKKSFKSRVPNDLDTFNYEEELVKNGGKWSPVKVYKKTFPRGVDVDDWKLRVSMLTREGYDIKEELVPFTLIITIRDIDREQPVYNEMTKLINDYNWEVSNLGVRDAIKV
jgi:serine protease AprX